MTGAELPLACPVIDEGISFSKESLAINDRSPLEINLLR